MASYIAIAMCMLPSFTEITLDLSSLIATLAYCTITYNIVIPLFQIITQAAHSICFFGRSSLGKIFWRSEILLSELQLLPSSKSVFNLIKHIGLELCKWLSIHPTMLRLIRELLFPSGIVINDKGTNHLLQLFSCYFILTQSIHQAICLHF
jgi:hypothetical protein